MNEPTVTDRNSALRDNPNVENYLHEMGLVGNVPSGTVYYNGKGQRVTNLGVHEHWNNPTDKQYSRNLGKPEGIELVRTGTGSASEPTAGGTVPVFTDVANGAWYADAVRYCRENGMMSGISADIFAPDMAVTRAMLVSILHRNAGSPDSSGNIRFSDIASGAWYADALRWAVGNSVVSGYSDGRFGPNDPVTREQLASILWRAEGSPSHGTVQPFTDQPKISGYARDAVAWTRERGIINGKSGSRFDPSGIVSRAEAAVILSNYAVP